MEKPLSLKREEFLMAVINAVNESSIPPFVALEVLRSVTTEAEAAARRQYETDKKKWEESQKEAEDGQDYAG